jgi:hypothetical protein
LNVYYKTETDEKINIPLKMNLFVDRVMLKETVLIEPLEETVFKIYGVYKNGSIYDLGTGTRYNGHALVFEQDGTFFKIPDNVGEVKFVFKIRSRDLTLETDAVNLTFQK